jgi:hypothetical protein
MHSHRMNDLQIADPQGLLQVAAQSCSLLIHAIWSERPIDLGAG